MTKKASRQISTSGQSGQTLSYAIAIGVNLSSIKTLTKFIKGLGDYTENPVILYTKADLFKTDFSAFANNALPLSVVRARAGTRVQKGRLYVLPHEHPLQFSQGTFRKSVSTRKRHDLSIDAFFSSIAQHYEEKTIAILLSDVDDDGVLGLQSVRQAGGVTMALEGAAEDKASSSIITETVDFLSSPSRLARTVVNLTQPSKRTAPAVHTTSLEETLGDICAAVQRITQVDIRHYKLNVLLRRIKQRMSTLRMSDAAEYLQHITEDPSEADVLFRQLLVGLTSFFRDPNAFEWLAAHVLIPMVRKHTSADPLRIWVPGCATGEEAYSLAILMLEILKSQKKKCSIKIIATDINERALRVARQGTYPFHIATQLSEERLKRFFVKTDVGYQISPSIRELCLFTRQNIIQDPPFSQLDLISCRNLLIYLGPHLQEKLFALFHFALKPDGVLFLGSSDNLTSHHELFEELYGKHRIARRKETGTGKKTPDSRILSLDSRGPLISQELHALMQSIILNEFAPKALIVDEQGHILSASGDMDAYLAVSSGGFQNHFIKLARSGLRAGLRSGFDEAVRRRRRTFRDGLVLRNKQGARALQITIQPMPRVGHHSALFLIVFEDVGLIANATAKTHNKTSASVKTQQLQEELATVRDELERTIQELTTANEELKHANQELLSMNEELQAANEELEASKEEVDTTNQALSRARNDLQHLFQSIHVGALFLDSVQRIRNFTPAIGKVYHLIESDIGRPLWHQTHLAKSMPPLPSLQELEKKTIPLEDLVETIDGLYFLRRVMPYFSSDNQVDGMVVTFADVTEIKRREQQLRELASVVSATTDFVATIDPEGTLRYLNPAGRKMLGVTQQEDVSNLQFVSFHPKSSRRRLLEEGLTTAAQNGSWNGETDVCSRDGKIMRWSQVILSHKDNKGQVIAYSTIARDITERQEIQRTLEENMRFLRKTLDTLFTFVGVCRPDGTLIEANRAALQTAGFNPEDMLNKPFDESYWWSHDKAAQSRCKRAITQAALGQPSRYDAEIRVAEDRLITIDFQIVPMFNEKEEVTHLVPSAIDISERKQTERALRESEERFRTILNTTAQAIYGLDNEGACTFANIACAEMLGYASPSNLIGAKMHALIHSRCPNGELYPVERCPIQHAFVNAQPTHVNDEVFWRADGTALPVEYWAYPMQWEGQIVGVVVTFFDLSERIETERTLAEATQAAEAANRAKSEFLANMSHEIRTPMTAILGYADILLHHIKNPDDLACVDTIKRNGNYLIEIINDVLDLSKIEAGKLRTEKIRFSPSEVISDVESLMQVRAQEKELPLHIQYDGLVPETIESDPIRLRQILVNLVGNAIKFTDQGHVKVVVRVLADSNELMFDISDTGIGISVEKQRMLFEPFTQADSSMTRRYGGSGLGLTISRRLVEMLGGSIDAQSEAGKGSVFTFTIATGSLEGVKLREPDVRVEPPSAPALPTLRKLVGSRVLIVDDRADVRNLIRSYLEEGGASVESAENGLKALELIEQQERLKRPYDVMILDMQMPVFDGYETARRLRERGLTHPIIALTSAAMKGDKEKCLEAGCDDYLSKPVSRDMLIERVIANMHHDHVPSSVQPAFKILVVEDSEDAAALLELMLSREGHKVEVAFNGKEALKRFGKFKPDVVFLDLGLPDTDGYTLVRELRAADRDTKTRIMALSGRPFEGTTAELQSIGFDHYFLKPVNVTSILETLAGAPPTDTAAQSQPMAE